MQAGTAEYGLIDDFKIEALYNEVFI